MYTLQGEMHGRVLIILAFESTTGMGNLISRASFTFCSFNCICGLDCINTEHFKGREASGKRRLLALEGRMQRNAVLTLSCTSNTSQRYLKEKCMK